jgi:methylenetetrahydrofolate dehydrogenase (NADP+)/methenyltetrahydrofolate cyclohydrolase
VGAKILKGGPIAEEILWQLKEEIQKKNLQPTLATVLVGEDPASKIYVRKKTETAQRIGIQVKDYYLPETTTEEELLRLITQLNEDRSVDGILVQFPLPPHISQEKIIFSLDPSKDVDGFHPYNLGSLFRGQPRFIPCTPMGIQILLRKAGVSLEGKRAVVVGRSLLVGRPTAILLLMENATVTIAHSKSLNLKEIVSMAEILIVAVGKPSVIPGEWVSPSAVVIDVGVNRLPNGKITGDVEFEKAVERAGMITPVPGGVGPLTVACLMQNTVLAHKWRKGYEVGF